MVAGSVDKAAVIVIAIAEELYFVVKQEMDLWVAISLFLAFVKEFQWQEVAACIV